MLEQQRQRKVALRGGFALFAICGLASGCLVSFDGYSARGTGSGATGGDASAGKNSGGDKATGGKPSAGSDSGPDAGEAMGGESSGSGGKGGSGMSGNAGGGGKGGSGGSGGGSSGTGGSGGSGGSDPKNCPLNLKGPAMIEVPKTGGGFFCMDRTEVPNEDYAEFLTADVGTAGQGTACTWNNSYQPDVSSNCIADSAKYDPLARPRVAVSCIDWCDAKRYCEWAGKHLCGKLGGGSNPPASYIDADASEWYRACSKAGTQKFPYGDTYQGSYCNGVDSPLFHPGSVANSANCEGGYTGLFDLSGNVAEWEDSCSGAAGAADNCLIRGGSLSDAQTKAPSLLCNSSAIDDATPSSAAAARSTQDEFIGFRCCYDF